MYATLLWAEGVGQEERGKMVEIPDVKLRALVAVSPDFASAGSKGPTLPFLRFNRDSGGQSVR